MYIAGRFRTASSPPNTVMDPASYVPAGDAEAPDSTAGFVPSNASAMIDLSSPDYWESVQEKGPETQCKSAPPGLKQHYR
jgi:hypothetical protein